MIKLMEKPDWIDNPSWWSKKCTESYFTATQIKNKFWDSDKWKDPYIPRVLSEKNWEPEEDKLYKCWWYWTNPADPADSGEDILVYIEELEGGKEESEEEKLKREYKSKINGYLDTLSLDSLKNLWERVKTY